MTETTVTTAFPNALPTRRPGSFRGLAADRLWKTVAPSVRRRVLAATARYRGVMSTVHLSRLGWLLALVALPFGRPLAPLTGRDVDVTVDVDPTPDGGHRWRRVYHPDGRAPVKVESVKRVDADGLLVECLGACLRMHLELSAEDGGVVFESTGYALALGPFSVALPAWLSPGHTRVGHHELADGAFEFTLTIDHPLFGRLAEQRGRFIEAGEPT